MSRRLAILLNSVQFKIVMLKIQDQTKRTESLYNLLTIRRGEKRNDKQKDRGQFKTTLVGFPGAQW